MFLTSLILTLPIDPALLCASSPPAGSRAEIREIFTIMCKGSKYYTLKLWIKLNDVGLGIHNLTLVIPTKMESSCDLKDECLINWTSFHRSTRIVWIFEGPRCFFHIEGPLRGDVQRDFLYIDWAKGKTITNVEFWYGRPTFNFCITAEREMPLGLLSIDAYRMDAPCREWAIDSDFEVRNKTVLPHNDGHRYFAVLTKIPAGQHYFNLSPHQFSQPEGKYLIVNANITIPDWSISDLNYTLLLDGQTINYTLKSRTEYLTEERYFVQLKEGQSFAVMGKKRVAIKFDVPQEFSLRIDPSGLERVVGINLPTDVKIISLDARYMSVRGRSAIEATIKLSRPANLTLLIEIPHIIYPLEFGKYYRSQIPEEVVHELTKPEKYIESDDPLIRSWADKIIGEEDDVVKAAYLVVNFIVNNLTYDLEKANAIKKGNWTGYNGAKAMLEEDKGVCADAAWLATALLRAKGFPARNVSGYLITSEEVKGFHAWFEFYVPSLGLVPADATPPVKDNSTNNDCEEKKGHKPPFGELRDHLYVISVSAFNMTPTHVNEIEDDVTSEIITELINLTRDKLLCIETQKMEGCEKVQCLGELAEAEFLIKKGDYGTALIKVLKVRASIREMERSTKTNQSLMKGILVLLIGALLLMTLRKCKRESAA